ncbi:MAG: TolB family protein [Planctomycetota bacterium]|jgi:dipeptidyl aminopeptidase/acylaminoacyl peptidase
MFKHVTPSLFLVPLLTGCISVTVTEGAQHASGSEALNWSLLEEGVLEHQVQLTFPDRFDKAGEAYFSPDGKRVIFQAVETDDVKPEGSPYAMYVVDLVFDPAGRVIAAENVQRLSPPGSYNTCGWFHPTDPDVVIFASTVVEPSTEAPGYQRKSRNYRWKFPPEADIYECRLGEADGTASSLQPVLRDPKAYLAECSLTTDARHLLYCSLATGDGDIYVKDLSGGNVVRLVEAPGYDGGPFFSPDGTRICYRSDRRGNDLLQLFVAELAIDGTGAITGLQREYQLTDNRHVNFAPFWHPNGRFIAYATSEEGHHNYEVFLIDADPGDLPGSTGTVRYGTRARRVTHASGFDGFPAFNADGTRFIWTSQRGEGRSSQVWVAEFVVDPEGR